MTVSIEWFLLDNTLMNLCVFLLAAALSGTRPRLGPLSLFSFGGAVYALLSLFVWPPMRWLPIKLAAFGLLALPMHEKGAPVLPVLFCVLLSAAMIGGAIVGVTLLTGGTVTMNGTVVGTLPLRSALVAFAVALLLPRIVRTLLQKKEAQTVYTDITVETNADVFHFRALIDTGNLLTEPISGLPIVLLHGADIPPERIVVYTTQGGESVLFAAKPKRVTLSAYGNCEVDCYIARAVQPIPNAQAVLPACLIPNQWRIPNATSATASLGTTAALAASRKKQCRLVYSQRRNPAASARPGRGSSLRRSRADRKMGEG